MNPSRPHLTGVLAGLFLAAGIAFAALVLARAWTRIAEHNLISVTGSARRLVRSDLVVWRASISTEAATLLEAQRQLQTDFARASDFLRAHALQDIAAQPIQIQELVAKERRKADDTVVARRVGYRLTQAVEIRSADVDGVPKLAGETGPLLEQGIMFTSEGFAFIYTKAGEAKVEMMAEATRDARARAEQIALQGGRRIKELRTARMGVVQINPMHSTATSWEGNNDTTAIDKSITATVSAEFALQ